MDNNETNTKIIAMEHNKSKELIDNDRYEYFLKTIVKFQSVWLLHARDGLYAMFEDDSGRQYIPMWPEKDFAVFFAEGEWEGYEPEQMELDELMDWLPELKDDGIFIGIFPDNDMNAIPLDPMVLKKQLKEEIQ